MMAQGPNGFITWLPLTELATAIQGLIDARTQLIADFYQLSGISDIMRGATDADETLGAQQLKSQYGSVRVREKSAELQRVAADTVKIAAEIIADKFPADALLEMSGLTIPKKAEIEKRISQIEKLAKDDLAGLGDKAQQAAQGAAQGQGPQQQPVDPQQAQTALQQAQQRVLAKYAPMLSEAEAQVPLEDVMKLLRDERTRGFVFEIESSSTILTDELEEKASRNEFLTQFTSASAGLMSMAAMGEQGAKLSGALLKFVLAPYRAGRELDGAIDEFIDAAPQIAQAAADKAGDDGTAEANKTLAQAETVKAQAALMTAQARAEQAQADQQRKIAEMQQKGAIEADKHQRESEKLSQQLQDMQGRETLLQAQVDNLTAQTAQILHGIGLDDRKQELSEYTAADDSQARAADQSLEAQRTAVDAHVKLSGNSRADRQQDFTEQTAGAE
jgi:biopolymer transport protein ExbD